MTPGRLQSCAQGSAVVVRAYGGLGPCPWLLRGDGKEGMLRLPPLKGRIYRGLDSRLRGNDGKEGGGGDSS